MEGGTTWGHRDLAEARDVASKLDTAGPFALELGGKTYTDRKNLKTETVAALIKEAASKRDAVDGGTFRGARILFDGRLGMGVTVHMVVGSTAAQHVGQTTFAPNDTVTASGFITRLENIVAGAAKRIDNAQARIKQSEKEATQAREDVKRGFPRADELKTKRERAAKVLLALKSGKRAVDGDPVEPQGPTAQFSRAEPAPFAAQVRERLASGNRRGAPLVLGRTPAVLRMLGLPDLPMHMPAGVLFKLATGKDGDRAPLTERQISQLPELLDEAVAVFENQQDGGVLALTSMVDGAGNLVLIAVRPDVASDEIRVNLVPTAFGKDGAEKWVRTQVEAGRLLFRGERKNPRVPVEALSDRQVRPEREGSPRNVLSEADLRNFRAAQRSRFSRPDGPSDGRLTTVNAVRAAVRQVLDGWKGDKPAVR